jgi:hypothetical protein
VNGLLGLVAMHIAEIVFYQRIKKTNLLLPMLTGKKQLPNYLQSAEIGRVGILPLALTLLIAVAVVWTVWQGELAI